MPSESFAQYITRREGFGKTKWPMAVLIHLFSVVGTMLLIREGQAVWIPLALAPTAALWFGTWMNYTKRWV
jgi:hypothetical protein